MNPIVFPLTARMQSQQVGDLQDALNECLERRALIADNDSLRREIQRALEPERSERSYRDITAQLVARFQEERRIRPSGEVDEPTAKALNELLRQWGLLNQSSSTPKVVTGAVTTDEGAPLADLSVRASHHGARVPIRLGEDRTDADGRYTIRYDPPAESVVLGVAALAADGRALATSPIVRNPGPIEIVDLAVAEIDITPNVVTGKVASRANASLGGLRVVIVDRGVGEDATLTDATSDDTGAYQAKFSSGEVRKRGKIRPDLQARVFSGETFLGASDVLYDAPARATLNILIEKGADSSLRSEHDVLTASLTMHFKGRLADLQETDERQDVTYLANKSGWDARAVALASLADQFSARTVDESGMPAVPAPYFYALFRAGLAANEDTLYRTDLKVVESALTMAADQGVIATDSPERVADVTQRFKDVSARRLLDGPAFVGTSPLKDMLAISQLGDQQRTAFAGHSAAHRSDAAGLWTAIADDTTFGATAEERAAVVSRLQVDGKLGYLTINNAPLMSKLHAVIGGRGVSDPANLAQAGLHDAAAWTPLLAGIEVPKEIPGEGEAKAGNYARYLAAQVRLSYPTASLAQMVESGTLKLTRASKEAVAGVHQFLTEQQGQFEVGVQPVQQYIASKNLRVADETVHEVKRLQRVYQMTPSDTAMAGLLKRGLDSTADVVRHDKASFVQSFADDLGGSAEAALTYDRAAQIHNTLLNVVLGYLSTRTSPAIGVHSPANVIDPTPANAGDVIAYATLDSLFGSMDFCACDHCRSVLSPAAYLVDLLQFLGSDETAWATFAANWKSPTGGHGGAPYPFQSAAAFADAGSPAGTELSPFDVLTSRRPDLQHLPLTCENTNTAIPYIDIVNETLEYFIANTAQKLSLAKYTGHDTGGIASDDLLASPQFVIDSAYTTLAGERFPLLLPFHRPLESVRRYFAKLDAPLAGAMERLRKTDDPERGGNPYGWRDILMEEIGLSRGEYEILTDSGAVPLWRMYGFPAGTADAAVIAGLSNGRQFALRLDVTYEDLVAILLTQFVNPNSLLVPKLERLSASFALLQGLKDGSVADVDFDQHLASLAVKPDAAAYGGDIKAWIRDDANFSRIMRIVTLAVPARAWTSATAFAVGDCVRPAVGDALATRYFVCTVAGISGAVAPAWPAAVGTTVADGPVQWTTRDASSCTSFGDLALCYSDPAKSDENVEAGVFIRLLRFIRLWRRLGWTIDQTDTAICSLYGANLEPFESAAADAAAELDAGFTMLLPRLGIAKRVIDALGLSVKRDLLPLLACWSRIGTHGSSSLYRQMFLNPALLIQDDVFADKGTGEFLVDSPPLKLMAHGEALRSAFNLTNDEFDRIVAALGYDGNTNLTVETLSAIYRRGWLARKLKVSVRELLLLIQLTGLDPFGVPDIAAPAIVRLIRLVRAMRDRSFKSAAALYLFWNQDLSNKSVPEEAELGSLSRGLRSSFAALDSEFTVVDDPDGAIAQGRMATVYGSSAATFFFGLLNNTLVVEMDFSDPESIFAPGPVREAVETAAGNTEGGMPRIAYDDYRKQLSYAGVLTTTIRDAVHAAAGAGGAAFKSAVNALLAMNGGIVDPFFARYPELGAVYTAYSTDLRPPAQKRATLLSAITPELIARRKRHHGLQAISAAVGADLAFAEAFLDPAGAPYPFEAAGGAGKPPLSDVLGLETPGLSVQFYAGATAAPGAEFGAPAIASNLDYAAGTDNKLPDNPIPANPISGVWRGHLEAPETGFFNLRIDADPTATVTLTMSGKPVPLNQNALLWTNGTPLELRGGNLHALVLTIENVRQRARVQWEWAPKGQGRQTIPARYLYPAAALDAFRRSYIRFLKVASLAAGLTLTKGELAYFATHADYPIDAKPWMNALAVDKEPAPAVAKALLRPLEDLLGFAALKDELATGDESLLAVLRDPAGTTSTAAGLLFAITRWSPAALAHVLTHLGSSAPTLGSFSRFNRVYEAMSLIQALGIAPSALTAAATNDPTAETVRDLQAGLRARYDGASWRDLVRPINDGLRAAQRDALVAYILHRMASDPASRHIDTADKLFEYFLMDVQMEPCMQTSRIRHALSSVQLFIERCLLNLEPRVSSGAINAKQWIWRKRYRVWEVNRLIYLRPENWCEPELRDDKSPLFKQLENELKQGDITDTRAAIAFGKYLTQLAEIAKLEPVAIHHVARDEIKQTGEVNHVVARSPGAGGKYYYRRQEYGYWTPWEQIKLDIEDTPVEVVVWKDRLLLFWLRVVKEFPLMGPAGEESPALKDTPLSALRMGEIKASVNYSLGKVPPIVQIKLILCWTEYQDGAWQTPRTSDVNQPADFGPYFTTWFDRSRLWLAFGQADDVLRIEVQDGFILGGKTWFHMYNTHTAPVSRDVDAVTQSVPYFGFRSQTLNPLRLNYWNPFVNQMLPRDILGGWAPATRVVAPHHLLANSWNQPLFYSDARHSFYVTSSYQGVWIPDYIYYGFSGALGTDQVAKIPPLVLQVDPGAIPKKKPWPGPGPLVTDLQAIDPAPIERFVTEDAHIRQAFATTGIVNFGTKQIGPSGAVANIAKV